VGSVQVIVGKEDGELTCFNTFSVLWKLRLSDLNREVVMANIFFGLCIAGLNDHFVFSGRLSSEAFFQPIFHFESFLITYNWLEKSLDEIPPRLK